MNPWDFIKSILRNKEDLSEEASEHYSSYLTNRALGRYIDTVFLANEMNQRWDMDKDMQYVYLLNKVRDFKRPYVKWTKPEEQEKVEIIGEYYGYSVHQARRVAHMFDDESLSAMKEELKKGGTENGDKRPN